MAINVLHEILDLRKRKPFERKKGYVLKELNYLCSNSALDETLSCRQTLMKPFCPQVFISKAIAVERSIAQWLVYLIPDPAAWIRLPALPKNFRGKNVDVAEVNQWLCSEES